MHCTFLVFLHKGIKLWCKQSFRIALDLAQKRNPASVIRLLES